MGERKVLNKYIPPDFDPKLVPRGKRPKGGIVPVRMMLPFSIQCTTCSSFMYRGRKFNSQKEPVSGSDGKYLGIQRFRFYIKCTVCSRPITFLTDPSKADYEMESGATRNYEVYKDRDRTHEKISAELMAEEKEDPMKALENRVLASQKEMSDLDNLDEIKAMNMRHLQIMSGLTAGSSGSSSTASSATRSRDGGSGFDASAKAILNARDGGNHNNNNNNNNERIENEEEQINESGLTESEEAMVRNIKFGTQQQRRRDDQQQDNNTLLGSIRRLNDEDERIAEQQRKIDEEYLERQLGGGGGKTDNYRMEPAEPKKTVTRLVPLIKVKRKRKPTGGNTDADKKTKVAEPKTMDKPTKNDDEDEGPALGGLLGGYGSDSD